MESRWRQNVPDMMMASGNWLLAARFLSNPIFILSGLKLGDDRGYRIWQQPDPDQLPTPVTPIALVGPTERFPYGFPVETDELV